MSKLRILMVALLSFCALSARGQYLAESRIDELNQRVPEPEPPARTDTRPAPIGTYSNPIQDKAGDGAWSARVHPGMYCVAGKWHRGWLRPGEKSPVIKPSCGSAVDQIPQ